MNRTKKNNTLASAGNHENVASSGFELKTLSELDGDLKHKVAEIINNTCPDANVVGVLLTPQPWDIRPFVKVANEKEIYVIRLLDAEILQTNSLKEEVLDTFEQLSKVNNKINTIREWGVYADQLWYRRVLLERTFEDVLLDGSEISFNEYLSMTAQVAEEITRWHALGFVHGHINYRNVGLSSNKRIYILDHKVGESVCRASHVSGNTPDSDYDEYIIAPEVLKGNSATTASDCYGFATLCRMLSTRINHTMYAEKSGAALRLINVLLAQMKSPKPDSRSTLSEYLSLIGNINEMMREAEVIGEDTSALKDVSAGASKISSGDEKIVSQQAKDEGQRKHQLTTVIDLGAKSRQRNMAADSGVPRREFKETTLFTPPASIRANNNISDKPPVTAATVTAVSKPESKPAAKTPAAVKPSPVVSGPTLQFEQDLAFVTAKHKPILKVSKLNKPAIINALVATVCLVCVVLLIVGTISYFKAQDAGQGWENFDGGRYSLKELQAYWESGETENMMTVLKAIVSPRGMNQDAEQIVVASILRGENKLPGLDIALLRAVYDPIWGEGSLTDREKRTAFVLASAGMFGKELLSTLEDKDISPIILFAMIASSGNERDYLLRADPLSNLYQLPQPVGSAFELLGEFFPNLNLADTNVKGTVKVLATLGENVTFLEEYLKEGTSAKLAVLATATSNNPTLASKLLSAIIRHPVRPIKNEFVEWARQIELTRMTELSSVQQFFLLAGMLGDNRALLKPESVVKILTHPSVKIRQEAIKLALQTIKFNHPAAQEVLTMAHEQPNLLTATQVLRLAQFMENPNPRAKDKDILAGNRVVQEWLNSFNEDQAKALLTKIVLAGSDSKEATKLDYEVIRYLSAEGWQPTANNIRKLAKHPDNFTRVFAYTETIHLKDPKEAKEILEEAQKTEKNEGALRAIQHNLKVLQEGAKK